ncbi:hypothetical protein VTN77DRAFT_978 [Rasamsonia byssochlamydoides]|uniref:uncharacterized protein n=1 Tax=Rasamsonia byssochlamydoides TaxID=89139 RepID=UPI003742A477
MQIHSIDMQIHPILLVLIEVLVTVIVVGFTAPSSVLRLGAFLIVALSAWQCITRAIEYMVRSPWAALVGGYAVTFLFHYVDVALVGRWSFRAVGPTSGLARSFAVKKDSSVRQNEGSWWDKFIFGLSITCTSRFIGTPYQVRNVPRFSNNDPSYVPSRVWFLQKTALTIFLCYLGLDLTNSNADPELNLKYFTTGHIPLFRRLHDVSADEILMRTVAAIAAAVSLTSVQRGTYCIVAFLSVLLNLSEPQDWPPFYGSLLEAYSLRKFWSRFWHQTNTHKLSSISNFLVHDVFRLPRGTLVARYARVMAAFAVSAAMHVLIDIAAGISIHNSGALTFFCTQILGIVVEDLGVGAYRYLLGRDGTRPPALAEKLVGFAWVGAFLVWSAPVYLYPMMYRANMGLNDSVVPVSLVGLLSKIR